MPPKCALLSLVCPFKALPYLCGQAVWRSLSFPPPSQHPQIQLHAITSPLEPLGRTRQRHWLGDRVQRAQHGRPHGRLCIAPCNPMIDSLAAGIKPR